MAFPRKRDGEDEKVPVDKPKPTMPATPEVSSMAARAADEVVAMVGPGRRGLANVPAREVHSRKANGWVLYEDYKKGDATVESPPPLKSPTPTTESAP